MMPELPAPDFAHLLAVARGAKLHQNLVTQRLSVVTASGARLPYPALQQLEKAGLVEIDRSHPLHAGQPVALMLSALLPAQRPSPTPLSRASSCASLPDVRDPTRGPCRPTPT